MKSDDTCRCKHSPGSHTIKEHDKIGTDQDTVSAEYTYGIFADELAMFANRVMAVGRSDVPPHRRLINYITEARAGSNRPISRALREMDARGERPLLVPIPCESEQAAIDHYGLENLLNVRHAGAGRKSDIVISKELYEQIPHLTNIEFAERIGKSRCTAARKRRALGLGPAPRIAREKKFERAPDSGPIQRQHRAK